MSERLKIYGEPDPAALEQMNRCLGIDAGARGVLAADNHKGYGMPIGGVWASQRYVAPAMAGYDIGCGNYAVKTPLKASDLDMPRIMDEIVATISFGVGRKNNEKADHEVLDKIANSSNSFQHSLRQLAMDQLGTCGSGNHYVDLFAERGTDDVWIGVHFGSRGFGHKTATYYLEQAAQYLNTPPVHDMDGVPLAIPIASELGREYISALELAGEYAYAGREWVVNRILKILQTTATYHVHNHHNFAWWEDHDGELFLVVRKGATPSAPGQLGFVGGSMGDDAVIIEGVDTPTNRAGLYSAMHGAGRVMGRKQAAGVIKKGRVVRPGLVDWKAAQDSVRALGVELRGAGPDEAPEVYKRLPDVIAAHGDTIKVLYQLRPIGVAMAGKEVFDPFAD